jgi:hypothetical protein
MTADIVRLDRVRQQQRYRCLLRDIVVARTDDSRQRLQRIALVYFARRLNDLGVFRCHWKPLRDHTEILTHPIFEHCTHLSRAIIAEPDFSGSVIEEAKALASNCGLKLWIPPIATASIRSPGKALFLLFTPPTRDAVIFLHEQVHGIAGGSI